MTTLLCVSASEKETQSLLLGGPRRDFVELARSVNGRIVYRRARPSRRGVLGRIAGPHIQQSFSTSGQLAGEDTCFADGEHIGIPLLAFLFARRKRRVHVVMIGHLVDKLWKRLLIALTTRLVPKGTLVVHSQTQLERVRRWVARTWKVELVPYQVDTDYWTSETQAATVVPPIVLAVGSENRDYDTLAKAATGLPVQVIIAAGSHWARRTASAVALPENVKYLDKPLPFDELRHAYADAAIVVVPVHDVSNQSGVTVILEAMSMRKPVVVTASRGQRECISGPTVLADGSFDESTSASRGPHLFGDSSENVPTGFYVPQGDATALRAAVLHLVEHPEVRHNMGAAGRRAAARHFSFERYVATLAHLLTRSRESHMAPRQASEPAQ